MEDLHLVKQRFEKLSPFLDERLRRLVAATEALSLGPGTVLAVARATGVSHRAIGEGIKELTGNGSKKPLEKGRIRQPGGGRKSIVEKDPQLSAELLKLVDGTTHGDPMSPLLWTTKSTAKLAAQLTAQGHRCSARTVAALLKANGYSLQSNAKMLDGGNHPDRDAQFEHINAIIAAAQAGGIPAVSVDAKKKELVGDFKNAGLEWKPKGKPDQVRVHDFLIPELGRAAPYGVYDITHDQAWVSVGVDHDTASFAAQTLRRWWQSMGAELYHQAKEILVIGDGGGSNGSRIRLWKVELQNLANELGMRIKVCHLPPGTSKWNKIEHRLFSFITKNWRGRPLISYEVIVELIAATTHAGGLTVRSGLDQNLYPTGIKVSQEAFDNLNIERDSFHGEWNYTLIPQSTS